MLNNFHFLISASTYPNIFMQFFSRQRSRFKRANEINKLEEATENGDYEYWLSYGDIADIARIEYDNYKINDIYSKFEIIGAIESFEHSINKFKSNILGKEKAHFTLIINLGNRHWVTLVLFYQKNNNIHQAYYLNSKFDPKEGGRDEIISYKNVLEKKFENIIWCDLSSFVTQQIDNYNCGFWVLENAADINQMLKKNFLLDWLIEKLNYSRNEQYFFEKRNYFSGRLRLDSERQARLQSVFTDREKSALKKSELENKQAIEITSSIFERQYLKRPIKLEDSLSSINTKKLKADKSIFIDDNELFISIYRKMTFNIINNLSKSSNSWATISDLCNYLLIDAGQLTEEKLDNIIKETGELRLDNIVRQLDKKNIIKQLQSISYIDKYLNVILYELDFGLCLISLVNPSYLSLFNEFDVHVPDKKGESSYILKFLHHKQNINIDLSLFLIYLTDDSTKFDEHLLRLLEKKYNNLEKIERNHLFVEEKEAIHEIYKLKLAIGYLLETSEVRKLSRNLVYACLSNDKTSINEQLDLLGEFTTKNSIPHYTSLLIFHASFKALILHNGEIELTNFLKKFNKCLPIEPNQLTHLFNKLSRISEIIYETIEIEEYVSPNFEAEIYLLDHELDSLVKNLSSSRLLWLAGLSEKLEKETLNFIWNLYSIDLVERDLLNELLEVAFIRNSVEILEWCQDKFNNNNEFIEKMYNSWMSRRDWGKGPYIKLLREEKIKLVFELPKTEESEHTAILTWIEENTETSKSDEIEFKRRELVFDLAARTRKKSYWLKYLLDFLSCNKAKVKESYAYSRFAAEAVMKRDLYSLTEFWAEISQLEDELKFAIQKKLLIDSTWAFHEAVRSGEKGLIYFFLSSLETLPVKSDWDYYSYRYNLLRGLDLIQPKAKNLLTNAVISSNIEVLQILFNEIKKLVEELESVVSSEEVRIEDRRDAKDKLADLRKNYYLQKNPEDPNQLDHAHRIVPDLIIAFYLAVKTNNESMVKSLLENVKDKMGEQTLKTLLLAVDEDQKTVMHWAVIVDGVEVQKRLIKAAENFGWQTLTDLLLAKDTVKKTALHLAVFFRRQGVLENLLEVAVQANILKDLFLNYDNNGADPLRLVIMNGDIAVMRRLLHVIKINFKNDSGAKERLFLSSTDTYEVGKTIRETILDLAVRMNNQEVVEELLEFVKDNLDNEIKVNLLLSTNKAQETTLDLAVRIGNKEIVKALLEALENNFDLATRNFYALEAKKHLSDFRILIQNDKTRTEDYRMMEGVLSEKCYLEASGLSENRYLRRKRNAGGENCEFSWEEVDTFNEEKEKPRELSAIKVNSGRFLDYIASQSMSDKKLDQLIRLADTAQVIGTAQDRVSQLVKHQNGLTHLNTVGQISDIAMQGMTAKNLFSDLIKNNYEGVAINVGFITSGQGFAKVAEILEKKGLKYIFHGQYIWGQSLRVSSSFFKRATAAFVGYDLVNQIKEYKKGRLDALVGIVGDSIYLGIDLAEMGVETAEVFSLLEGVSSVTGPIGASIGAIVFVGTDVYFVAEHVHDLDKQIHLTNIEKFVEGLLDFLNFPQKYIQKLVEEKQANNELVIQAMKIFEQNKNIKKYIFPSAKIESSCMTYKSFCREKRIVAIQKRCRKEEQLCSVKQVAHKDNVMLFDVKKVNVKLSRAKPDDLDNGHFFCLPAENSGFIFEDDIYYCENTIGVEYLYNRTAHDVLISLGAGNDTVIGFPNENHHIFLDDGYKDITLGEGNDTFILQGHPTGVLRGGSGSNLLDLGAYASASQVICVDSSKVYDCHTSKQMALNPLEFSGINRLLLRKSKQDWIWVDCNINYIDTRGGKEEPETDFIFIDPPDNLSCLYDIKLIVRPYTRINYCGGAGIFSYIIPAENKGFATVSLLIADQAARHEFIFDYTLSDINAIKKTENTTISFDFVKADFFSNITADNFFFIINGIQSTNISYRLSDNTEIKVGNDSLYALQSIDKSAEEIIRDYPKIANKLKMYILVTLPLKKETIAIGNGNYDVLYNNPYYKSHLVGNGGENIFRVTSGYEILDKGHLPIPEVILYDVDEENLIDTLDLTAIREQLEKDLDLKIEVKIKLVDNDILINLLSTAQAESVFVTVRLKNAWLNRWYKRLHIILNHVPMELKGLDLTPLPLQFSRDKEIIVIFPEDIAEKNELIIDKKSGNYYFARSGTNLVITNALDQNITTNEQRFTLLFIQFYQIPKMETLSIQFIDKKVFIKSEIQRIMHARPLEEKIAEYKQAGYRVLFNSTTKFQRNRRSFLREKENVSSSAISLSNPIGQVVGWLKEKSYWFISRIIPGGYHHGSLEPPTPTYKPPRLEYRTSNSEKKKNNRFVRNMNDNNWIDNIYLLKYGLHYLGWNAFVDRANQAERRLAYPHVYIDPLDLIEQHVKKALASYERIDDHDCNEQVVLYSESRGSTVNSDSLVATKQTDNREMFFSQSFAQNDSRIVVSQEVCQLIKGN